MADIVINHRVGTTQGHGGAYNRFDGIPMSWDEHAITSCSGGLGNQSTGSNFPGVPNIDHTQPFVRKEIINWLIWLRENLKFQDFRFDFAKGYDANFVKEYVKQSKPIFSVGEYWDSCSYSSASQLDYNQGAIIVCFYSKICIVFSICENQDEGQFQEESVTFFLRASISY
ncbi:hypothetical protein IEQ34_014095 [Dendrobium chrysotoxum]|uniref:1,4-alpha-D-glucan glucanohydrolase n=1 Tax=Dendrobium chrysotoxum TaxID=161865 RepID=A0AAV7GKL7_DENCH|nr:hypothetical protein IEQ34_014095 [Dendrobium chrysotoxum]